MACDAVWLASGTAYNISLFPAWLRSQCASADGFRACSSETCDPVSEGCRCLRYMHESSGPAGKWRSFWVGRTFSFGVDCRPAMGMQRHSCIWSQHSLQWGVGRVTRTVDHWPGSLHCRWAGTRVTEHHAGSLEKVLQAVVSSLSRIVQAFFIRQ